MSWIDAAILGVVQGLTEFLPVSSTAHLLIGARLLHFEDPGGIFTVMIQLGSILAVVWLYRAKLLTVVKGLPSDPEARHFALMILIAFVPAVIAGALFAEYVKRVLYTTLSVLAVSFIAGGIVMLIVERFRPAPDVTDVDRTSFGQALGIGISQVLALIPGVSRSGATIVGAMLLRLDRPAAAEFSFFLAIPTMIGAFAYDFYKNRSEMTMDHMGIVAIGFVVSFITAIIVVKTFLEYVTRHGFVVFAWWRVIVGTLGLIALASHWL